MKVIIQRVLKANVIINKEKVANINNGLLIFLGIVDEDSQEDIDYLICKTAHLRIFNDENGVMNKSLVAINGEVIVVSQFTLYASTKKGNRPSYIKAAKPSFAIPLYEKFILDLEKEISKKVQTGRFGTDMKVDLINDGPVTIIIDSKNRE